MKTGAAAAGLVALCCGVHLLIPLLAAGAVTGLVGGLAGQASLAVAGVILAFAMVVGLAIRKHVSRPAGTCELSGSAGPAPGGGR